MPTQKHILYLLELLRRYDASIPKVRIGALGDGGYVLNDDLENIDGVLSLGIGGEVSFDLHFANNNIKVYQYDPTVEGPPITHPNFVFRKLWWDKEDGPESRSLATMIDENGLGSSTNLVLKFDVEGAEWRAMESVTPEILSKFRVIVTELHDFCHLSAPAMYVYIGNILRLLTTHHMVTHIHPNNSNPVIPVFGIPMPNVMEVSFLRKDRAEFVRSTAPIPSELDYPNAKNYPDIVLTGFSN